jgi:hypothetical protein
MIMEGGRQRLLIQFELLWWVFTLLLASAVVMPIYLWAPDFLFFRDNMLFVVVFITLTRYIFLLQHSFWANQQILKVAMIFASMPLVFMLIQQLNTFQTFLDENGPEAVIGTMSLKDTTNMIGYVRSEMLLFSVGSIIAAVVFPMRLMVSVWQVVNRKKG